jgi:hypothetical protein
VENAVRVPETLGEAVDPAWLSVALKDLSGGAAVTSVATAELIKTVASKARIVVEFEGAAGKPHHYCLKAFLDQPDPDMGGTTTIREADFYADIAPRLSMRLPHVPCVIVDRANQRGILVMEDMIVAGAKFITALDVCDVAFVRDTLDQLARLHARSELLDELDWVPARLGHVSQSPHLTAAELDALFARPGRTGSLSAQARDGATLLEAMKKLSALNDSRPHTLLHGDCHAGNIFVTAEGPGLTDWQLIQRGFWALDVAYHLNSVLSVEVAAEHERALLDGYLAALQSYGGAKLDRDEAWADYRAAVVYGYYQWAITRFVKEEITEQCIHRLGSAVDRHDSFRLLGLR